MDVSWISNTQDKIIHVNKDIHSRREIGLQKIILSCHSQLYTVLSIWDRALLAIFGKWFDGRRYDKVDVSYCSPAWDNN